MLFYPNRSPARSKTFRNGVFGSSQTSGYFRQSSRPICIQGAAAIHALEDIPRRRLENLILVRLARQLDIGPLANLLLLPTIARFPDRFAFLWEASFPQDNVMRQIYPSYRKGRRIWFCTLRLFQLMGLGILTAFRLLIPGRSQRPLQKV